MQLDNLQRLIQEPKVPTAEECARSLPNYLICTPYWGNIDLDHLDSMHALQQLYPQLKRYRVSGCAYIDIARATLCREVERGGFDGIMFIDHDIVFWPPDVPALIETAEHEQCAVSGIYSMRASGDRMIGCFDPSVKQVIYGEGGGLYPAPYSGLGFTAIPRKVLDDVGRDLPLLKTGFSECRPMFALRAGMPDVREFVKRLWQAGFHPDAIATLEEMQIRAREILGEQFGGWYSGEDISFFHRVKEAGHRLLIDTRPRLFHKGSYLYGLEDVAVAVPRARTLDIDLVPLGVDETIGETTGRPPLVAADAHRFEGAGDGVQWTGGLDPAQRSAAAQ